MIPATPAQRGPGPRQTSTDSRTDLDRRADENRTTAIEDDTGPEDRWDPIEAKAADAEDASPPLNSPDEPFALKLRKPITSSRGQGGKVDTLVITPPTVLAFCENGAFVRTVQEEYRNQRTGEIKTITYSVTDYTSLLKHLSSATKVPVIELNGMSAADAERAGGILFQMSRGAPFR